MSINVSCSTNLDGYEATKWPMCMACRPIIGDRVMSDCGSKSLKIASITHHKISLDSRTSVVALLIELHK